MDTQLTMPCLGEARKIEMVAPQLIAACKTRLDAVRIMINLSGLSSEVIADKTGIDPGHLSRILKGKASPPADARYTKLVDLCGNNAPLQWENKFYGYKQVPESEARIAELQNEIEQIRRQA